MIDIQASYISFGPLTFHFYGMMYALAAICGYFVTKQIFSKKKISCSSQTLIDMVFWAFFGGIIGGRIFYVLFYDGVYFWNNPGDILAVWKGGMSIHGGLIGGVSATILFLQKKNFPIRKTADLLLPALALGLMFGRIGNIINGELMGRVTEVPWGVDFGDGENRHLSSGYSVIKNILLFGITLFLLFCRNYIPGMVTGIFFVLLGVFRFCVEFFREPDSQIGFLAFGLSLGQHLSFGVISFGIWYGYGSWRASLKREK